MTLYLFALREADAFLTWDPTADWATLLAVPNVPVLWRGVAETIEHR